jgi:hypothetical protein
MHLEKNCHRRIQGRQRLRIASGLMLILANLAGLARAAEFDEKVIVPLMKDAGTMRAHAQSFSARFGDLKATGLEQLVTNRALASEQFDLVWQLQQAIDVRRPLGDIAALGFVSRGDGSYDIDFHAFPQWERVDRKLAALLPTFNQEALVQQLTNRGFTADEAANLQIYLASHDANAAAKAKKLPVALGFSKLVKKFDMTHRTVPDSLVLSYVYQRERASADATREWAAGLLNSLGAHGARILLSTVNEGTSTSVWAPSDQSAGIADTLAIVRRPDFEELATAQIKGETP